MPDESPIQASEVRTKRAHPTRTCVGCGAHDDAAEMVHVVVCDEGVAFDTLFAGRGGLVGLEARGRGAHVHARAACVEKAPAGIARTLRRPAGVNAAELGRLLVVACERRMSGLLVSARRLGQVAVGADAALDAAKQGAPLVVVAVDAGTVAEKTEVADGITSGRCVAWRTKLELGALLGDSKHGTPPAVAICAVRHEGIAAELKKVRAAADAGAAAMAAMREGARCRRPEAR